MPDHDLNRGRLLSDYARMDDGYDQLRAVAAASGDTPLGTDIAVLPLNAKESVVLKARPFPAYDNPSSRVVLLLANQSR